MFEASGEIGNALTITISLLQRNMHGRRQIEEGNGTCMTQNALVQKGDREGSITSISKGLTELAQCEKLHWRMQVLLEYTM